MLKMLNFTETINHRIMKSLLTRTLILLTVLFTATSCELVGDIFQVGMGVGIFLVILIIAIVVWIISRFRR